MRYKFRGKEARSGRWAHLSTGEWIYGLLIEQANDFSFMLNRVNEEFEVATKTIGQYTGLKDCNGVEIYEGDILSKGQAIREVYFHEGGFYSEAYPLALSVGAGFTVIGNIYDNPELMKGGSDERD